MSRIYLYLILLLFSFQSKGLDTIRIDREKLFRQRQAIEDHPTRDTIRVNKLIHYAEACFYDLDFLNGLIAAAEARSISKTINYNNGKGLYLKCISIFRRRVNAGSGYANNLDISSSAYEYVNQLDIYYEVLGNRILGHLTDLDVFGNIKMPSGSRDLEIDTIKSNLEEALSYFSSLDEIEINAYLHEALAVVYFNTHQDKSTFHKETAQRLYRELDLSYHQIMILVRDIDHLLKNKEENLAQPLEIEAFDIYSREQDHYIKAHCAFLLSRTYVWHNRMNLRLDYLFQAEDLLTELQEKDLLKSIYSSVAITYEWYLNLSEKALEYEYKELNLRKETGYYQNIAFTYLLISESLFGLNKIEDFPPEYRDDLKQGAIEDSLFFDAELLWVKARMLQKQGKKEAQSVFLESIEAYMKFNDLYGASWAAFDLAESFLSFGNFENALKYAQISYDWASEVNLLNRQLLASDLLSRLYEQAGQVDKAFHYLKQYKLFKDENDRLNNAANRSELEMQTLLKKRQREVDLLETEKQLKEQENKTQRIWLLSVAGALASLLLFTFMLIRNNRQKQKTNHVLEATLANLKATQAQLIQSEKMASLGELTAGIAHEIQNPLNFVNNFSELNVELVDEAEEEINKGDLEEVRFILKDLKENSQKINHHGKRADSIVKGMLQHSRTSTGQKELTDINALADEYLRLSYHGMRAKDKSFNADFVTDFDPNLPKINVIPQDIGRVLLNLINNAFQAVYEKSRNTDQTYSPKVTVSSKQINDEVEITVSDNGPGIPDDIKDKIFQPFFTTKPTGQGTGLGLSLSYDIVKAHGGELQLETNIGSGSKFIITFPLKG